MKELLITVFYLSGAFSVGFDANGISKIQPCTWYAPVQKATGVKVKIDKFYRRRHFAPELQRLEDWTKLSYRTFAWMQRQKARGIRIAFLPPLVDPLGNRYMAGLANVCKPHNGLAVVNVQETRSNGTDGIYPSTIIATHELAHVAMGATHDDTMYPYGASIMHSAAGHYAAKQRNMKFSPKSIAQGKACLKRWGFRK